MGHQALLEACVAMAERLDAAAGAITFDAHPKALFSDRAPALLTSLEDRLALLKHFGMQTVKVLPVTAEVMGTPWEEFLCHLAADGAVGFVCGRDFRFGRKGQGDAGKLEAFCRQRGIECRIVEDRTLDGIRVSSSHIRDLLEAGDLAGANRFLGHPHVISGSVVAGRQLGRTIGVPTANLVIPEGVLCPRFGVYACLAHVAGKRFAAVTNIGNRPTVGGHRVTVEPWLLDFQGDLYGKTLTLELRAFLREERKFESLEALKAAILENEKQTRMLLGDV